LVIFIDFFIFLIQIQIWILGPVATAGYRYRTPAVAVVTAVYRAVTTGKKTLAPARLVHARGVLVHLHGLLLPLRQPPLVSFRFLQYYLPDVGEWESV
jgi:hypothetical protein